MVERPGFNTELQASITLGIDDDAHIDTTMALASLDESVKVVANDVPFIETSKSGLGRTITRKQIDELPVAGRDFTNLALLTPGILADHSTQCCAGTGIATAAQIGRDNFLAIDGLSAIGTQSSTPDYGVPLDAIKEFVVLTNGFSAEHGQASGAVVNVLTRSGSNQLAGRAFYYHRDDALDATPAAARLAVPPLQKSKLEQKVVGGFAGGPLVRNRVFFFDSVEHTIRDSEAIVTSPVRQLFMAGGPTNLPQPSRSPQVFARTDVNLTPFNIVTFRYGFGHNTLENRGVGGLVVHERGSDSWGTAENFAALDNHVVGSRGLNEFRFQHSRWDIGFDTTRYCFRCAAINRPSIQLGSDGSSRRPENRWQLADSYTYVMPGRWGDHVLKAGVDASLINHEFIGLPSRDGTFHFSTDLPFNPGIPATYPDQYTRADGPDVVRLAHNTYAMFVQDQWKPGSNLTLNLGARWDYDDATGIARDRDNVAPRIGVAFDPWKKGRTKVRGSYGVYYDAMYLALARMVAQAQTSVRTIITNPGYPDPLGFNPLGAVVLPPSTQQLADNMETPRTAQATVGFEQALFRGTTLAVDAVWARGRHLIGSRDHNYPDLDSPLRPPPRPNPAFQQITVFETEGHSWYRGLQVLLQKRHMDRYSYSVTYTLSTSERDTEDFTFLAQDQRYPAAERGPSSSDVRHRLAGVVNVDLPFGVRLATLVSAQSALPYNVTSGKDDNGDSVFNDRPPGVGRNSARGDDFWQTDVRLGKDVRVGNWRIELLIEAFNVLNQSNWIGYVGNERSQSFGKPTASTDPRQVQLGIRVDF
jgi:hypothetical protein